MKFDLYIFEYSTKSCGCKLISYAAGSFSSALRRFTKNTRHTNLFRVFKNGNYNQAIY